MKRQIVILAILSIALFCKAQVERVGASVFRAELPFTSVDVDDTTPDWARLLYTDPENYQEIRMAFSDWRRNNPEVYDDHTRNYKHYNAYIVGNGLVQDDGKLVSERYLLDRQKAWSGKREKYQQLRRNSQAPAWQPIGPSWIPQTLGRTNAQSNIYAIDQSKSHPHILYCGSETDYVFKSTDSGDNWTSVNEDLFFGGPMELEIHPSNPDIVYLGTQHDIWRTTDGGTTWTSLYYNWNFAASTIIINPTNPNIILAGGSEGLLRTTNGGTTWSTISTTRYFDLKFKTDDSQVVFALVDNPTTSVTDFYRSTNGGLTFTQVTTGWSDLPSDGNSGGRMTVSDDHPDIIYTFTGAAYNHLSVPKDGAKVRKSTNAGLSWTEVVTPGQVFTRSAGSGTSIINRGQGYYDWDIEMVDGNPDTVLLGTQGRWLTYDGFSSGVLVDWGVAGHSDLQEALFNGSDYWVVNDGGIVKLGQDLLSFDFKSNGINAAEFWSFDQGWNRNAQVGTLYHNGTVGRTDTYGPGVFRFYGGAEPEFSALKHPYPDKIISKGYGSVNGRSLPDNISDTEESFSYNLLPNADLFLFRTREESEIEYSPYGYNIHWAGQDNVLYLSQDFGVTWDAKMVGRPNGKITKIEIPKANPMVMYVAEFMDNGDYALYKSTDAGENFAAMTGLPTIAGTDNEGVFISVDHTDEDILYLSFQEEDNDNDKVWKTEDGGTTWTNYHGTSSILDGEDITDMIAISGTDGDVYLTSYHGVFHRSDTTDWQMIVDGLPANLRIRHIKPFYKESQVMIATMNRGVYYLPMINVPTTFAIQPTTTTSDGRCARDTFQFDDFSTINQSNASWAWSFTPQPAYIDDAGRRDPRVVFGQDGDYQAVLTVTIDGQPYVDSLDKPLTIESACHPDTIPGLCYQMENYGDHGIVDVEGEPTYGEWSVSFWIKPDVQDNETATIFDIVAADNTRQFCANFKSNTESLTMHYLNAGSSAWGVTPPMTVTTGEWNHVAYTSSVSSGEVTIYVNGVGYTYPNVTPLSLEFDRFIIGWQNRWWGGRFYQGLIDELAVYDKALTESEVRLGMYLTKNLTDDPNLIHYYQWNDPTSGVALDKVALNNMTIPAAKVMSDGPFASGTVDVKTVTSAGTYDFDDTGVRMTFGSGSLPSGDVYVTRLHAQPDVSPSQDEGSNYYWVMHSFGASSFTVLDELYFEGYGRLSPTEAGNVSEFELYRRDFGQFGTSWGSAVDLATTVLAHPVNEIAYDPSSVTSLGQFYITKGDCASDIVVKNALDSGPGSLREAVSQVCPEDTITFATGLNPELITLTTGQIDIDKNVYIRGNASPPTTLNGNASDRIFRIIDPVTNVGLEQLTLEDASAPVDGGAILNYGELQLLDCLFQNNMQGLDDRAITNYGRITIPSGLSTIKE